MADYDIPDDLRYTREDEWCRLEGNRIVIGVTDYAQQQLGDIVFVELPAVGSTRRTRRAVRRDRVGEGRLRSLRAGVAARSSRSTRDLADHPEHVNEDCYGDGWMIAIAAERRRATSTTLLDAASYRRHVEERSTE